MRIGFIGGGVMAEAMIRGLLAHGLATPAEVMVGEVLPDRRAFLESLYGLCATDSNVEAAAGKEIIVLAVKPQQAHEAMSSLRGALPVSSVILTIAAGVRIQSIADATGHRSIARVMPNMPAQIGQGMSVWTTTPEITGVQREQIASVLRVLGKEAHVDDERYLDMATALSGSGPGYILLFLEALIDAGVHIGLARPLSTEMARQTLLGTALLASDSDRHPADLRNLVTSPGGTTAEGLLALEEGGLRAAVVNAVIAAFEKSKSLG